MRTSAGSWADSNRCVSNVSTAPIGRIAGTPAWATRICRWRLGSTSSWPRRMEASRIGNRCKWWCRWCRRRGRTRFKVEDDWDETRNSKLQAPSSREAPSTKLQTCANWSLGFEASLELGCCCLELTQSPRSPKRLRPHHRPLDRLRARQHHALFCEFDEL